MANRTGQKKQMSSNNLVIVMVLISLLVIGVTGLTVKVLITSIVLDSHVLKAKLVADSAVRQDVNNAPQLISSYNALGKDASVLNDALPTSVDYPSLLVEMENMAGVAGVSLQGITTTDSTLTASPASSSSSGSQVSTGPSAAAGTPGTAADSSASASGSATAAAPQQFTFMMSFTGSYDSTTRLITALEASVRPMEVTAISLTGMGNDLTATINVTTWYASTAQLPFGTETVK